MIFVTVGTTHFDSLIEAMDRFAATDPRREDVVFQIGAGRHEPRHGEFFRFRPSIDDELSRADLVVTHGGATVFSLLAQRKRFVAVANTGIDGNHQARFLRFLGERSSVLWSEDPSELPTLIARARELPPAELTAPSLRGDLRGFIVEALA